MKSGTSITRSCGEVFKSGDPEQTRARYWERKRENEGERKCRWRRRSEEQEILDSRDAYSQCDLRDFRSIPCRRVSCINNVNDRSPCRILCAYGITNKSTAECNEIIEEFIHNKSEIKYEAFYEKR